MEAFEFNVSHLLRLPIGSKVKHDIASDEVFELDDRSRSRYIRGSVELIRTNFGIFARAQLSAAVELECDRCLDRYDGDVRAKFEEEYLPVIDVSSGRPVQSERTDETFFISPNHIVDLTDAVRQHLLLAIPMHTVCSEDCRGLCPTCGTNLNLAQCGCVDEEQHPFAAIAVLLTEREQYK
jgi:DUF177 domain-containing protein